MNLSQTQNKTIYVYNDIGVLPTCIIQTLDTLTNGVQALHKIQTVNAADVIKGTWRKDAALFIMPGGADQPYVRKLNGDGNAQIKAYVENGGSYLGICAGAYYGSCEVEFDKDGPLEVVGKRELKFFQGKSIGPVLATFKYGDESGARAAIIRTSLPGLKGIALYYNGGGHFEHASDGEVLATYHNGLAAIVRMNVGKGSVILSGVHFEYNPEILDSQNPFLQQILPDLLESNSPRVILAKHIFQQLGVENNDHTATCCSHSSDQSKL